MRLAKFFSVNHTKQLAAKPNINETNNTFKVNNENTSVISNIVALYRCLYVAYIVNFEHIQFKESTLQCSI